MLTPHTGDAENSEVDGPDNLSGMTRSRERTLVQVAAPCSVSPPRPASDQPFRDACALDGVDLDVAVGTVLAPLGPTG